MVGARVGAAVPLLRQSSLPDLLVRDAHNQGHLGVTATTSKVRALAWVINLPKLSKKVVRSRYGCRLYNKETVQQLLGSPPDERLKPSLPFTNGCLDLFGPINVRLTMSKTDIGKAYGVIITCMFTRAIHLDVAAEYSTEAFLQAFRNFTCVHRLGELPRLYFPIQAHNWWALMLSFRQQCERWIANMRPGLAKTFVGSLHRAEHHGDKAAQSHY